MGFNTKNIKHYIATFCWVAMFFSCTNNTKEVRDFLADQNKPIGVAKNIDHIHKDSGKIINKLKSNLLLDFTNRKEHPYNEFPKGIQIVIIEKNGKDSTTITGNYAISYAKTKISEIKGNVVIINHTDNAKLETTQLFWDQKEGYIFTEDGFRFTTTSGIFNGFGFESKQDLSKWIAKDITGDINVNQKEL